MENQRRFDLLLAAMPEKVLDQIMDVIENWKLFCWRLTLWQTRKRWTSSSSPSCWVAGSHHRCWPQCWPTVSLAWSSPSCSSTCFCIVCRSPFGLCWGNWNLGDVRSRPAVGRSQVAVSRSIVANVGMAEEQLAAQIAAVQKKEHKQKKKKLPWKKVGGQPPATGGCQAVYGSGSGSGDPDVIQNTWHQLGIKPSALHSPNFLVQFVCVHVCTCNTCTSSV